MTPNSSIQEIAFSLQKDLCTNIDSIVSLIEINQSEQKEFQFFAKRFIKLKFKIMLIKFSDLCDATQKMQDYSTEFIKIYNDFIRFC